MPLINRILADNMEIRKRERYCILIDHRRAGFEILHPSEAYVLSLLNGKMDKEDLENTIGSVYGISVHAARELLDKVLAGYAFSMVDAPQRDSRPPLPDPEDLLYPGFEDSAEIGPSLEAPLILTLDLTRRCNFRCGYCYYGKRLGAGNDMPGDMALKIIDDAARSGVVQVFFGGAESLLHPRFCEIIGAVTAGRMVPSFTTNGSLLTRDMISRLVESGVGSVGVSIDTPDPLMHHRLTRSTGSFAAVIAGIKELKESGVWVRTVSVMTNRSVHTAGELIDFLAGLGVDAMHICPYSERSCEGKRRQFDGSLSPDDKSRLFEVIGQRKARYPDALITVETREETWAGPPDIRPCTNLSWGFAVHNNGNVFPCELIEDEELCFGNLFESGIKDVWQSDRRRAFFVKTANPSVVDEECASCPFLEKCHTGCFNLAKVGSGNFFSKDPRCPGRERISAPR